VCVCVCAGQELFVRGFPQDVSDEKIKKFFSKNGVNVAQIRRVKGKQYVVLVDLMYFNT